MTEVNNSPITSVPTQEQSQGNDASSLLPPVLLLELRGITIELERELLINLPESILIVMFPNGVILSKNPNALDESHDDRNSIDSVEWTNHIIYVDFSADMLHFILNFYQKLGNLKKTMGSSKIIDLSQYFGLVPGPSSPFTGKYPFVILREELDYFSIPKSELNSTLPLKDHKEEKLRTFPVKTACGQHLLNNRKIFDAFERNIHGGNNLAERQLVDMLCKSGFTRQDEWGYRNIEPVRTTLTSIAMAYLDSSEEAAESGITQKLLLFWRKPARKCWWDIESITLEDDKHGLRGTTVKLWSRRIWTLELALA